ncbi:U3 small nucleolar RNA-associated protein 6 homolog [Euwallacea fornicatus]|uniref:U3 small nucleolar RNA-associated protein 6 homolog n=1 Tax=Euwallacea fornicatus TaxID=995702 RepID=UPI00338DD008
MDENVQFGPERCAKEIAKLKADGLFSDQEVKNILNKDRELENILSSGHETLDDYKSSIAFMGSIITSIRRRKGRKDCEWFFISRVVQTYKRAIRHWPTDYPFHVRYYNFLKLFPELNNSTTNFIKEMIERFICDPKVFRLAASWYLHINNEVEAKKILCMGQSMNPENLEIYLDLLEIELNSKDENVDSRLASYIDFIVETKVPRAFVEQVITLIEQKLNDTHNVNSVIEYGLRRLLETYANEGESYVFAAFRPLNRNFTPNMTEIQKMIYLFRTGIKCTPENKKSEIANNYIHFISKLIKDKGENPQLKSLLLLAMEEVRKANVKLCINHYVKWVECSIDDPSVGLKKVEEGLDDYKDSESVWGLYIKFLLMLDRVNEAYEKLHVATNRLKSKAVKVWDIFLSGVLASSLDEKSMKEFFEAGLRVMFPEIVILVKTRYFSWASSRAQIEDVCCLYRRLAREPPYCRELHEEAFLMERMHCGPNGRSAFLQEVTQFWKDQFVDGSICPDTAESPKKDREKLLEACSCILNSTNQSHDVQVNKSWYGDLAPSESIFEEDRMHEEQKQLLLSQKSINS